MDENVTEEILKWIRSHYFGKYRGLVTDNQDLTGRGRLKVKIPSVLGDLEIWAMPCVPYAGKQVGFYSLPDKDTGVWVEFEGGDTDFPVWTGCFWGDGELPDMPDPKVKIWKTDKATLRIDDMQGQVVIKNSSQTTMTLAMDAKIECGQAKHTVAQSGVTSELGNGKVEISAAAVKVNNGALEVT